MASHCCPAKDALDMVKHDSKKFQIFPKLHLCNKAHSVPNPINIHLDNEDFITKKLP
jgi:hypothetical protein